MIRQAILKVRCSRGAATHRDSRRTPQRGVPTSARDGWDTTNKKKKLVSRMERLTNSKQSFMRSPWLRRIDLRSGRRRSGRRRRSVGLLLGRLFLGRGGRLFLSSVGRRFLSRGLGGHGLLRRRSLGRRRRGGGCFGFVGGARGHEAGSQHYSDGIDE